MDRRKKDHGHAAAVIEPPKVGLSRRRASYHPDTRGYPLDALSGQLYTSESIGEI